MFDPIYDLVATQAVTRPGAAVMIVVGAFVVSRLIRFLARVSIRRLASRSRRLGPGAQPGLWRARTTRVDGETGATGEQRRRQRIDAASRMVGHLISVLVWLIAVIALFHVLDIDAAFFLSSAGFIGAAIAIGGQHKVNDYLTGLSVHFEDRYGVGDRIVADIGGPEPVEAIVDHVGLFSTRLRDAGSTVHVPNHALSIVRNLSQDAAMVEFDLRVPVDADEEDVAVAVRRLAGTNGLTEVVFLGDIEASEVEPGRVAVKAPVAVAPGPRRRQRLVERAERSLRD